ncbi:MAG TPA: helix-turn-helix transcriptional regulator [Longimicrobium sp.]|jgi:transcriptional regulator with XRE-family HTH domain
MTAGELKMRLSLVVKARVGNPESQEERAAAVGLGRSTLRNYESATLPVPPMLARLARALDRVEDLEAENRNLKVRLAIAEQAGGVRTQARQARPARLEARYPLRKVVSAQVWKESWTLLLDCDHVEYSDLAPSQLRAVARGEVPRAPKTCRCRSCHHAAQS